MVWKPGFHPLALLALDRLRGCWDTDELESVGSRRLAIPVRSQTLPSAVRGRSHQLECGIHKKTNLKSPLSAARGCPAPTLRCLIPAGWSSQRHWKCTDIDKLSPLEISGLWLLSTPHHSWGTLSYSISHSRDSILGVSGGWETCTGHRLQSKGWLESAPGT